MASITGNPEPTPSTSSVGPLSSNISIPVPTLTFTDVPDQVFTCTNQIFFWNSTGLLNDPNSNSNNTIASLYPFSLLNIGIAGSYNSSVAGSTITQGLLMTVFTDFVFDLKLPTNFTIDPITVPPGIYAFFAALVVNERIDTGPGLNPVALHNFTSSTFMVLNGTNTSCVVRLPLPSPSSAQGSAQTSGPVQNLSSATGKHLNGGAIAGITIGSIVAALLIFLIAAFLRFRFARSYPTRNTFGRFGRMGIPAVLKPSAKREKKDTADFIGLQSFDSSHVPS